MTAEVRDNPDQNRFEAYVDGEFAGFAEYRLKDTTYTFTHTEVSMEGQGVGSALARHGLDAVRAANGKAVPLCPFIKGWIDKHPDYQDLVAS